MRPNVVGPRGALALDLYMCVFVFLCAGIGKSTLLNLIGGVLEPTAGTITRNAKVQHSANFRTFRYTPTDVFS